MVSPFPLFRVDIETMTKLGETPFESIKHVDENGEYWLARELMPLLDYDKWQNFESVIQKAKQACRNSSEQIAYHFTEASKMIKLPKGAERQVKDSRLTRYACYLIAQNSS